MKFLVKSIVGLDKIHISGFDPEPTTEPERHPLVQRFIEQFAEDPTVACRYLVERSNPRVDALTLASLIFKTSELDKEKIGVLLAGNEKLLRAFLDRFHFTGMRIDHALRMFLLSLRFPSDDAASDTLLRGFAYKYHQANEDTVTYDASTATDLVMSIMQLNETLYGMDEIKLASSHLNEDVFISAWRAKDPEGLFSNDLLSNIFSSVRDYPLAQALEPEVEEKQGRPVVMSPARLPSKMTYNTWSESIRISIPSPDPNFGIELLGEGLEFDPPILALGDTREAVFRVRGKSLGTNSILFYRVGRNA